MFNSAIRILQALMRSDQRFCPDKVRPSTGVRIYSGVFVGGEWQERMTMSHGMQDAMFALVVAIALRLAAKLL